MAQVNVTINARPYQVACGDGEEAHLTRLAEFLDKRVQELAAQVGQVGETRLLLMTALLMADDILDGQERAIALEAERDAARAAAAEAAARFEAEESKAAAYLDRAANRMEALAQRLAG